MWVRGHWRSFKVVPFESLGMVSYSPSIVIVAISLAISDIFSVKQWPDLEMWVWGRSRSLKMAWFDRPYMTFYYSAIVTNYRTTVCELFDVEYAACFPSARTPPPLLSPTFPPIKNRVTTCMENLEKSGILTAVKEMSEILLKVGEVSGKKSCQEKWPKTAYCLLLAAYLRPFLTLLSICISFWFQITHRCIPTPTIDINTSPGMIGVTLNIRYDSVYLTCSKKLDRSARNRQGNVMEFVR